MRLIGHSLLIWGLSARDRERLLFSPASSDHLEWPTPCVYRRAGKPTAALLLHNRTVFCLLWLCRLRLGIDVRLKRKSIGPLWCHGVLHHYVVSYVWYVWYVNLDELWLLECIFEDVAAGFLWIFLMLQTIRYIFRELSNSEKLVDHRESVVVAQDVSVFHFFFLFLCFLFCREDHRHYFNWNQALWTWRRAGQVTF